MSRNFDKALLGLKDTFPSPDPKRREDFLNSLPQQKKDRNFVFLPFLHFDRKKFWYAIPAAVTAAVMLTVGITAYQKNPPHQVEMVETTAATTTTAAEILPHETVTETVAAIERIPRSW